ncbi:MAG: CHAD domain-containing protein [Acidobacteria bacterium]|nr:CHAD domain-containing protein [Acidobacteriota bacterium]
MTKAWPVENLDCRAGALAGMGMVLQTRLAEVCAYREAALDFTDIEGVHNMRVASRRLRSALSDFQPHLVRRVPKRRLKRVADALGAVRDEDVAIVKLEELAAELDGQIAEGVHRLLDERHRRREQARAELQETLDEGAVAKLSKKLGASIERATGRDNSGAGDAGNDEPPAAPSFRQAGREIIRERFAELEELGASLYRPRAVKQLHRMRIAAKRLRYAVELFTPCWGGHLEEFSKEVEKLQKSLGELHDLDEWIAALGARLQECDRARGGKTSPDSPALTQEALVWLLARFARDRARHYANALARWQEWQATDFGRRLSAALKDEIPEASSDSSR